MKYICVADLHIRPDKPLCRAETQEEWIETQFTKLKFILDLSEQHGASLLIAGDIFHRASDYPSWLLSRMIRLFSHHPQPIIAIPGQHDLPYHQLDSLWASNLGVLNEAGTLSLNDLGPVLTFPWGVPLRPVKGGSVALTHQMIIRSEKDELWPGQAKESGCSTAIRILRDNPTLELIVSGDNHQPFAAVRDGRWLVNPGSMTRQRSNEKHSPGVYLYDSERGVERIPLPFDPEVVLEKEEKVNWEDLIQTENNRVDAFIKGMNAGEKLNYADAVQIYLKSNKVSVNVQKRLLEGRK